LFGVLRNGHEFALRGEGKLRNGGGGLTRKWGKRRIREKKKMSTKQVRSVGGIFKREGTSKKRRERRRGENS